MLQKLAPYRKTIIAIIGSALTWAIANYANDPEVSKYLSLVSALLTAAGVFQIANREVK